MDITFDKSARKYILNVFNKSVDDEGFIVEKDNPEQRVLAQDGQQVEYENFAGIRKGSEIFIKSDLISLMHLCDSLAKK